MLHQICMCVVAVECTMQLNLSGASIDYYGGVIDWLTTTSEVGLSWYEVTVWRVARPMQTQ